MADKEKVIRVSVDPSGVRQGVDRIKREFESLHKTVSDRFSQMGNSALFTMGAALSVLGNRFKSLGEIASLALRGIQAGWGGLKSTLSWLKDQASGLIDKFASLKTVLQGVVTSAFFRQVVHASVTVQKFASTLSVVTGSLEGAKEQMGGLIGIVNKFGVSFEHALAPFAKFFAAAKGTLTENEIIKIFTSFTEVSAALQLNVQEVQGVFLALQQIASKGRVSMEELRLQLAERVPGAMQIAASAMGMSIRELEDAIRRGTVSSGEFLKKFGDELHKNFGQAAENASKLAYASIQRFRNSLLLFMNEIGEGGFTQAFQRMLGVMTDWFNENHELARRIGQLLGDILNKITDIIAGISDETIASTLNFVIDGLYDMFDVLNRIGNSRVFKWMFGGESKTGELRADMAASRAEIDRLSEALSKVMSADNPIKNRNVVQQQMNYLLDQIRKESEHYQALRNEYETLTADRPNIQIPDAADRLANEEAQAAALARQLDALGKTYNNVSKEIEYNLSLLSSGKTKVSELEYVTNQLNIKQKELNESVAKFKGADLGDPTSLSEAISSGQKISGIVEDIVKLRKQQYTLEKQITAELVRREKAARDLLYQYSQTEDKSPDLLERQLYLEDEILKTRIELDKLAPALQDDSFTTEQEARFRSLLSELKSYQGELKSVINEQRQYAKFKADFDLKTDEMLRGELNWYEKLIQAQEKIVDIKKELIDLNQKAQNVKLTPEEIDRVKELQAQLKSYQDDLDDMSVFAKKAAENIQDLFADFLFDPFKDGVDGMLAQFGEMLRRMIAEAAAAQIGEMIFGKNGSNLVSLFTAGASFFSGLGGGGGSTGFTGSAIHAGGTRAHGGPVMAGMQYLVNDRQGVNRPEIFVPNQSGRILTKSEESAMPGKTDNTFLALALTSLFRKFKLKSGDVNTTNNTITNSPTTSSTRSFTQNQNAPHSEKSFFDMMMSHNAEKRRQEASPDVTMSEKIVGNSSSITNIANNRTFVDNTLPSPSNDTSFFNSKEVQPIVESVPTTSTESKKMAGPKMFKGGSRLPNQPVQVSKTIREQNSVLERALSKETTIIERMAATTDTGSLIGKEAGLLASLLGQQDSYESPTTPIGGTRAHGGPVMSGVPYLVNDRKGTNRGEIFVPNQSGRILTKAEENTPAPGQSPINVYVTVSNEVTRTSAIQAGNDIARQLSRARGRM